MTDNTVSVCLGADIQFIGERFASGRDAYFIIRQRDGGYVWRDLRISRDPQDMAHAFETLRRFYLGEPLT